MKLPSPQQREVIRTFLHEATDLHIDAVTFAALSSGIAMTVHYRDQRGHSHNKTLSNPDATHMAHIEDMAVLASEWLTHPTTTKTDELVGNC